MENKGTSVLQIDLDAQDLFGEPNFRGTPERNLLMAVLERAILDFVGNDEKEVISSEEWIFGELKNPDYIEFSFPWICQQLDIDVHFVAETIRNMPKRGSRRVAPWYFQKTDAGELKKAG
ncbi:MAG: hypothetical protein KDD55_00225 [Bdellovibrionales bacterium]|nr:hypothetical protein [Bdellovibrionales bacterium]